MPPQVNLTQEPERDIETLLLRHLDQTLRACGFEIRDTKECGDFKSILRRFVKFIADRFGREIDAQLNNPKNPRTRADLVSWTISEIHILQAITFGRLQRLICDTESKNPGLAAIDCELASAYTFHLTEIYKSADEEWKRNRAVEPSSNKHQDKRKRRNWAPYLVNLWPGS